MIFAVDVYYHADKAIVAGVLGDRWEAGRPTRELTTVINGVSAYERSRRCTGNIVSPPYSRLSMPDRVKPQMMKYRPHK